MTVPTTLLTHPGGAHKDEFLACSVLLAIHSVPLVRREPTTADLDDPAVIVVDVGLRHEPARNNFDHHQFPKDHTPTCALSLVLQHLGLYEDARQFCEWLETAEWFDCRGPIETARWLGAERDLLGKLASPIDFSLLRRFAGTARLEPGEPLWEIMRMVGEDFLSYVRSLRLRLDELARTAEFWDFTFAGQAAKVLFLPRTDPLSDEPSFGIERFVSSLPFASEVVGVITPDRRGTGYGLSRFQDHPRFDFSRIAADPVVHFAHARGFLAKTSTTSIDELKRLLLAAATP